MEVDPAVTIRYVASGLGAFYGGSSIITEIYSDAYHCYFLTETHDYNTVKKHEEIHLPSLYHDNVVIENQYFL